MAVTVLQHMKEDPEYKPLHLYNAIRYVLDVRNDGEKTDFGKWVGGNSGMEFEEIFSNFMDTKSALDKLDGRQGYHFMISFDKNEDVSAQTCFDVLQDFCKEYLGDEYDYVFAVHTDKDHMHGHIVFNSINKTTGRKYRYEKGDWEKYIQPITDKISQRYNLSPLVYGKNKVGIPYARWAEVHQGKLNWTHIIRADVDYAIENSSTWEDFLQNMKEMKYTLDLRGYSKKHQSNYITFRYTDSDGKAHKKRSFNLTSGEQDDYSVSSIIEKIKMPALEEPYYEKVSDVLKSKMQTAVHGELSTMVKNTRTYSRMYQAVSFYKLPNPYAESYRAVRKDILRIEKLIEDSMYLKNNPMTYEKMEQRFSFVSEELKKAYVDRKALQGIDDNVEDHITKCKMSRYRQLQKELSQCRDFDDKWEAIEDELEELEKELPAIFIEKEQKLRSCERKIEIYKKEKRILGRVLETEGGRQKSLQKNIDVVPGM